MKKTNYQKLDVAQKELLLAAREALRNAYNPYSKFSVGAALLSLKGEIITGANVENAAYGSSICAERSALVRANAMGIRKFSELAVIGQGAMGVIEDIIAPCGACRQMLFEAAEISGKDLKIIMSNTKMTKIVITTISELLPLAFGPKDLKVDINKF